MPTTLDVTKIGPVDVAVIAFETDQLNGQVAPALAELQANGIVRIIDLAFVVKDENGSIGIVEIEDSEVNEAFGQIAQDEHFDLLGEEEIREIADALTPGQGALVIVWENTWAAKLASAIRDSGGFVVAMERIPLVDVLRAIAALEAEEA
jgi:uncharacterized membrane protein